MSTLSTAAVSAAASAASAVIRPIRVEPLLDLEWSRAVEPTGPIGAARRPSQTRRAWIHRAPEADVVSLYQRVLATGVQVNAPWWLRALAGGTLQSRMGGFAIEDQVSEVLDRRAGWAYMPWAGPGEDGYWEYVPSELDAAEVPLVPTTVMFTDRHQGWLDVVLAHAGHPSAAPLPLAGPADLRSRLELLENG
ncbi:MAG TPA: hypothetical protein VHZ97_28945 [Pseudonocardiaceae bacterium]|nr:hypothetical protein [Pseudonocardiaceae bacterium]